MNQPLQTQLLVYKVYPAYLAEVEALLIGLAYEGYPHELLNDDGVPGYAPANTTAFQFQLVSE